MNPTPEFVDHSKVINGASELFLTVFGNADRHTRVSLGVNGLSMAPRSSSRKPIDGDRIADRLNQMNWNLDCPGVGYAACGAKPVGDLFPQLH